MGEPAGTVRRIRHSKLEIEATGAMAESLTLALLIISRVPICRAAVIFTW